MNSFVFHHPTKIIFGKGTASQVGDETAAWAKKALFVYGQSSIKKGGLHDRTLAALPVLTLLRVPAAGSEMNGSAVVSNEETKQKYGFGDAFLFPKLSILDPSLTLTIPKEYGA